MSRGKHSEHGSSKTVVPNMLAGALTSGSHETVVKKQMSQTRPLRAQSDDKLSPFDKMSS